MCWTSSDTQGNNEDQINIMNDYAVKKLHVYMGALNN